ncbi:MAG: transglycosylase SLT domain-containing protein [Oligoflexia bacterium]|nr:transglycosylase SLT domain-containing protein [Oligoflexia bacterium]
MFLSILLLFSLPTEAKTLITQTPVTQLTNLRLPEKLQHEGKTLAVLVIKDQAPESTTVSIDLRQAKLHQWILNSKNLIVQNSMPYYIAKILSTHESRSDLLGKEFYIHISDLNPSLVISNTFDNSLPDGVTKTPHPLPWDAYNPQGTWSYSIDKSIDKKENQFLLNSPPRDIEYFCPRYFSLDKTLQSYLWQSLISHIVRFESLYIPLTASDEGRYDSTKKGVISSGLTQISLRSIKASCYQKRGCSSIKNQEDLYNPEKNLSCALGIMSCLTQNDGCISCKSGGRWQGIAKYWSTLQEEREISCPTCPGGKVKIGKKALIKEELKNSAAFCF